MVMVIFRSRLQPAADRAAMGTLYERLSERVSRLPGFIAVKDFAAADGESVAIAEFESLEAVDAWKHDPEHLAAQRRGREEFFAEYTVQVCTVIRTAKR